MKEVPTYLFQLNWVYWDSGKPYLYYHPKKTPEEFNKDVDHLMIEKGKEYLDTVARNDEYPNLIGWVEFIATKLPELGYIVVIPIAKEISGPTANFDGHEVGRDWIDIIGEDLYNRAVAITHKYYERRNENDPNESKDSGSPTLV